jgi:site-specific DNA-cytosine methylase
MARKPLSAISLFTGAGGLDLGFDAAHAEQALDNLPRAA